MPLETDILIVGAGHGGAQAAIALRQRKYEGRITIVGEEPDLPYERPPLSKEYLAGEKSFDRILIRPEAFWASRQVTILTGRRVVALAPDDHKATFADGETIRYGTLVWAAGGRPRRLSCPGRDLAGIHTVRDRADADKIIGELADTRHVVVVGGGYIGLEAAAVLTKSGKQVTLLEAMNRVLARVAGESLSRFYEAEHRSHGVDIRLGASAQSIEGRGGRVTGVRLGDGSLVPADMVIVGIGIIPAVEPLLAAGAKGADGVEIDDYCRTSLADVYAIGDCALHVNAFADGRAIRLESIQNANDMAATAASALTGEPQAYHAVPTFWSNQYDLKLQTVGLSIGHDRTILRGDPAHRSFSVLYLRQGKVIALDCVNAMKDYVQGRGVILADTVLSSEALSDPSIPLKSFL